MKEDLRIVEHPRLEGTWKDQLYGPNSLGKRSLLYHMPKAYCIICKKGVLFEMFRSSTKKYYKKDALKENLLQSDREFPSFSYSQCSSALSSTEVLLKTHSLDRQFICITVAFANMNIFMFQFSCLHSSILNHLRCPTVSEATTWDLQI